MPILLILIPAVAIVAVWLVRYRTRQRRQSAICRRLEHAYELALTQDLRVIPLCPPGPRGGIGLSIEGVVLGLDPSAHSLRFVPWQSVEQVSPWRRGMFSLHISRVGDVMVPGSMGRQIWERMRERAASV